jgi:hypothetical protein
MKTYLNQISPKKFGVDFSKAFGSITIIYYKNSKTKINVFINLKIANY